MPKSLIIATIGVLVTCIFAFWASPSVARKAGESRPMCQYTETPHLSCGQWSPKPNSLIPVMPCSAKGLTEDYRVFSILGPLLRRLLQAPVQAFEALWAADLRHVDVLVEGWWGGRMNILT